VQRLVIASATVLALVSAWHLGPHMWGRIDHDYVAYRSYTTIERQHAPLSGLGLDGYVFDWYAKYLARGDRIYFQVQQSGLGTLDLPSAVLLGGSFYLLPAVAVKDLSKATVVVSWLADPGLLHVHFITQQRLGLQLMFVSRIRAPEGT
jgi:hypothetical protein